MNGTVFTPENLLFSVKGDDLIIYTLGQAERLGRYYRLFHHAYVDVHYYINRIARSLDRDTSPDEKSELMYLRHRETFGDYYRKLGDLCMELGDAKMAITCYHKGLQREHECFLVNNLEDVDRFKASFHYKMAVNQYREYYLMAQQLGYSELAAKLKLTHGEKMECLAFRITLKSIGVCCATNMINRCRYNWYCNDDAYDTSLPEEAQQLYHWEAAQGDDGRWGIVNYCGEFVVAPQYDTLQYEKGIATVELNGRSGEVDLMGNEFWEDNDQKKHP